MVDLDINSIYKQIRIGKYILRYFPNKNPRDLFWHRDKQNRDVKLIIGDVKIQKDNQLPEKMKLFKTYTINKNEYHRVISSKCFLIFINLK